MKKSFALLLAMLMIITVVPSLAEENTVLTVAFGT